MRLPAILLAIAAMIAGATAQAQDYDALDRQAEEQWRARDYAAALQTFEQGLAIAQTSHDLNRQIDRMGWICSAHELLGETLKSLECYESSLKFYRVHRKSLRSVESEEESLLSIMAFARCEVRHVLVTQDIGVAVFPVDNCFHEIAPFI